MKEFKGHESCPECGSKDNLGVWSDGQQWCFGCGYYVPSGNNLSREELWKRINQEKRKIKKNVDFVRLPFDFTLLLPPEPLNWLQKYGITEAERYYYKLGWSEFYESLVLPSFDIWGNLLVVQRRYFGTAGFPKYHTRGKPESVVWTVRPEFDSNFNRTVVLDTYNGDIVIVEDIISAIKVGRHCEVMPLWGSQFSNERISQLAQRWQKITFWLDYNKTAEATNYRYRSLPYFKYASVISTEKDPKAYNDTEIRSFLTEA